MDLKRKKSSETEFSFCVNLTQHKLLPVILTVLGFSARGRHCFYQTFNDSLFYPTIQL